MEQRGGVGVEAFRDVVRVRVSLGLVFLSLVAEVVFVALVGYGLYHAVRLLP
jgi:hypothetical protein